MKRILFLLAALAMAGNVSAMTQSRIDMKEYDSYTRVTCTYWMPAIEYAAPLDFDFHMGTSVGETATFQFSVPYESNRYVEFGSHGTRFLLRKTKKGKWIITLRRDFRSPEGQVTCDGAIYENYDQFSDFKRVTGYFDRNEIRYSTTWQGSYYVSIDCEDGFPGCDDNYTEGELEYSYTYLHREPLRMLPADPDFGPGRPCDPDWGCGPQVEVGIDSLIEFNATLRTDSGYQVTFTKNEVENFSSYEVIDYAGYTDASSVHYLVMKSVDAASGAVFGFDLESPYPIFYIDFPDGSHVYEYPIDSDRVEYNVIIR